MSDTGQVSIIPIWAKVLYLGGLLAYVARPSRFIGNYQSYMEGQTKISTDNLRRYFVGRRLRPIILNSPVLMYIFVSLLQDISQLRKNAPK